MQKTDSIHTETLTLRLVVLVNEHAPLRKDTALKSTRGLINNSGSLVTAAVIVDDSCFLLCESA